MKALFTNLLNARKAYGKAEEEFKQAKKRYDDLMTGLSYCGPGKWIINYDGEWVSVDIGSTWVSITAVQEAT